MKLSDIIVPQAIVTEIAPSERDEVITLLVDRLLASGVAPAEVREELIGLLLQREQRGTTGFGYGVAVPHGKHASVSRIGAAVGLSARGIDFSSLDRQPVYSVFLLLSPADSPEDHIQAMEVIFKNLNKDAFRRFLRQAQTPEDVIVLLQEADSQQIIG